ncbi:MAG TPA: T9SS type A sorting domain-containing protein [Chitinophagales bacterium]|nr:T9SS type A sorting domain-containing protein [Chitinophagales bacterium]
MKFLKSYRKSQNLSKYKLFVFLITILSISISELSAQFNFKEIDYIPVKTKGQYLKYPWAGGLNSAQMNDPDLNGDGIRDLLVYEKTENRVLTFITVSSGAYRLNRDFIPHIPPIQGWVVTKDMNCDGIDDLMTYNNGSIAVYRGYRDNDTLKYELWLDEIDYFGNSGKINLYGTFVDRPAFVDIDNDGDLDILTFNVTANRILLYKNQRVEKSLGCDTLVYILNDNCWGNIFESGLSPVVDIRDTCTYKINNGKYSEAQKMRHAGSTLEAFDIRGRGVMDVLMGDVSLSLVNYMKNDGDRSYASVLKQDTSFPSYNIPARVASFPLTTFIDVDHDGKKDLIVTPFEGLGVDNYENVLLYKNIGTDSVKLSFQTRSFMVGDMIDVGENATPCVMDVNGDGLKDLIIGGGYRKDNSIQYRLHYYKNIGTNTYPVFQLENDDFLNFSTLGLSEPHPHAGDLDNDGKEDFFVGLSDGRILYYKNISTDNSFQTNSPTYLNYNGAVLDIGQNAAPFVIDIDKNGQMDLLVGEYNGNINLYKNVASAGNINLQLVTDSLGEITTTSLYMPFGYSNVSVADIDQDGRLDLLVGGFNNVLQFVSNIEDSLLQKVHPVNIESMPKPIGRRLVPHFTNMTSENDGTLLIGLLSGGVRWMSLNPPTEQPVSIKENSFKRLEFNIYPNPTSEKLMIEIPSFQMNIQWMITDMMGRKCLSGKLDQPLSEIYLQHLSPGGYLLNLFKEGSVFENRLFIKSK